MQFVGKMGWLAPMSEARLRPYRWCADESGDVRGYTVTPGAFRSEHGRYGHTSTGLLMQCVTSATDARFRWRSA